MTATRTVPGFWVQAVLGALKERQVELSAVQAWQVAQPDPAALALPWAQFTALLHAACKMTRNPAFGLELGHSITEANLHMLGPIVVASRTLREAIEHVDAVQQALFGSPRMALHERDDSACYEVVTNEFDRPRTDLCVAALHACAARFVGPRQAQTLVARFAYAAPAQAEPYRRLFSQRVEFDAARSGVRLPRALLDQARSGTDPTLATTLRQIALERFASTAEPHSWTARLESALREHTELVHVDFDKLAARWQISSRTLRRRVETEGEGLLSVLNRVRFERACQQLEQSAAPISKVAEALGYSDVSAFARAFKRATGVSPGRYRQRARQR